MIKLYPNNFFALSVFACIEVYIIKKIHNNKKLFLNYGTKYFNYNIYLTE